MTDNRAKTGTGAGFLSIRRPVCEKWAKHFLLLQGMATWNVLDFGAGRDATTTRRLQANGWRVDAYDLPANRVPGLHLNALPIERYDMVIMSNVLNVQESRGDILAALREVGRAMLPDGILIANYPREPRRLPAISEDEIANVLSGEGFAGTAWQGDRPAAEAIEAIDAARDRVFARRKSSLDPLY